MLAILVHFVLQNDIKTETWRHFLFSLLGLGKVLLYSLQRAQDYFQMRQKQCYLQGMTRHLLSVFCVCTYVFVRDNTYSIQFFCFFSLIQILTRAFSQSSFTTQESVVSLPRGGFYVCCHVMFDWLGYIFIRVWNFGSLEGRH